MPRKGRIGKPVQIRHVPSAVRGMRHADATDLLIGKARGRDEPKSEDRPDRDSLNCADGSKGFGIT